MAINRSRSTAVAAQPIGTSSIVFSGFSSLGGYNYGTTPQATYLAYVLSTNTNAGYSVGAEDSGSFTQFTSATGGVTNFIRVSTTESNFGISQYIVWSSVGNINTANSILCTGFGNGVYLVGGSSNTLRTSTDLITWTSRDPVFGAENVVSISYGNGIYVLGGSGGGVRTSTDLVTWTSRITGFSGSVTGNVFGNGIFVLGETASQTLRTSTDGITWTTRTHSAGRGDGLAYGNGIYGLVSATGAIATSTDAITWTNRVTGVGACYNIAIGNNYLAVASNSGNIYWATTGGVGGSWNTYNGNFGVSAVYGIAYTNGVFVAGGQTGVFCTATVPNVWTTRTSNFGTSQINYISAGNGVFVAGGAGGSVRSSAVPTQIALYATAGARLN